MTPDYCLLWIQSACMPRSDWAAWVQAIGSLLALYVAFKVASRQIESAQEQERLRRAAQLEQSFRSFLAIGDAVVAKSQPLEVMAGSWDSLKYHVAALNFDPQPWRAYAAEIEDLRAGSLPSAIAIEGALDLKSSIGEMMRATEHMMHAHGRDAQDCFSQAGKAQQSRDYARKALDVLRSELVAFMRAP